MTVVLPYDGMSRSALGSSPYRQVTTWGEELLTFNLHPFLSALHRFRLNILRNLLPFISRALFRHMEPRRTHRKGIQYPLSRPWVEALMALAVIPHPHMLATSIPTNKRISTYPFLPSFLPSFLPPSIKAGDRGKHTIAKSSLPPKERASSSRRT